MQLEVGNLKENKGKSLDFRFEEDFSPINLGGSTIAFDKPVVVDGSATNVESGILVDCRIRAGVVAQCHRCLRPLHIDVETTAVEEFVEAENVQSRGRTTTKSAGLLKII